MNEITIRKKEELDPQEKSFRRRKDLIKNFIIIFLVVMLVLTFFSNTIMNYSLPKVAVQYVQPGTITSVIRGSGTVESGDPYNVMVKQSKTVGSINCKVGQEVAEGDLLITLEAEDSQELKDAKKALEDAKKAYNNILLSDKVDAAIISSAQGDVDINAFRNNITATQNAVTAAEKTVNDCQAKVDALNNQISITSGVTISEAEKTQLENFRVASEKAKTALDDADANLTSAQAALKTAEAELSTAQSTKAIAKETLDQAQSDFDYIDTFKSLQNRVDNGETLIGDDASAYNNYLAEDPTLASSTVVDKIHADATAALIAASDAYNTAAAEEAEKIASAQAYLDSAKSDLEDAKNKKNSAQEAYNKANKDYNDYNNSLTAKQNNATDSVTDLRNQLNVAQIALNDANKVLEQKKKDLADLVAKIGSITELTAAQDAIDEAQKTVDKYQEETGAAEVYSPISGTILNINVSSGKKTSTDDPVVVLQPAGMGYTMKFSLENDKAKTISIGDPAEVTNSWWYSDVTGSVATIRPDPSDPNRKKEVTLNLEGSLTAGQTIAMSISSRTQNYDLVVPSSAIHDGNNGKYILVIESKSSPLGNRYFANKYDVEELASDDTQTAISAGLMGYEYVVTTASKPIEPGAQVQLNENN